MMPARMVSPASDSATQPGRPGPDIADDAGEAHFPSGNQPAPDLEDKNKFDDEDRIVVIGTSQHEKSLA